MTYRRLLVPLSGDKSDDWILAAAAVLADHYKAHLDIVFVRPDPSTFAPYYMGTGQVAERLRADVTKAQIESWDRTEADIKAKVDRFAQSEDIALIEELRGPGAATCRFLSFVDDADKLIPRLARCCDLTIYPLPYSEDTGFSPNLPENTLLQSGRPVLFLPNALSSADLTTAGIAWDGSPQAAQTVAQALPLIQLADQVEIISIDDGEPYDAHTADLAEYFACLGIPATADNVQSAYERTGLRILEEAEKRNWDLLIMGGYGHARWREHVFSGATRQVLEHAALPVVQAH